MTLQPTCSSNPPNQAQIPFLLGIGRKGKGLLVACMALDVPPHSELPANVSVPWLETLHQGKGHQGHSSTSAQLSPLDLLWHTETVWDYWKDTQIELSLEMLHLRDKRKNMNLFLFPFPFPFSFPSHQQWLQLSLPDLLRIPPPFQV